MKFTPIEIKGAHVIPGRSRGRRIGIPTINIDPAAAKDLQHGIYACRIAVSEKKFMGAMHYGPRPVFKDSVSFEVHILDESPADVPDTVDIDVIARIRDVMDFDSPEALVERIRQDIEETRAILSRA